MSEEPNYREMWWWPEYFKPDTVMNRKRYPTPKLQERVKEDLPTFCNYCKKILPKSQLTTDHIIPRRWGLDKKVQKEIHNTQKLCPECHKIKTVMEISAYEKFKGFTHRKKRNRYLALDL